jgi:hypothetical protein
MTAQGALFLGQSLPYHIQPDREVPIHGMTPLVLSSVVRCIGAKEMDNLRRRMAQKRRAA